MNELVKYDDNELINVIIEKASNSDRAFYELYNRYSSKLNSYCLFISENSNDAEEIFQDTWLKFYRSLDSTKAIESVAAYLYKIAHNLSIDKYRLKKNKFIKYNDKLDFDQIADPLDFLGFLEQNDLMKMVSLAVNILPDIYKETFLLLWFSGLSYSEIACVTGETIECVRTRSYRAMRDVIKILKPVIAEISEKEKIWKK